MGSQYCEQLYRESTKFDSSCLLSFRLCCTKYGDLIMWAVKNRLPEDNRAKKMILKTTLNLARISDIPLNSFRNVQLRAYLSGQANMQMLLQN